MLEYIAIQYVNQSDGNLRLIGYGTVVLGAMIAAIFYHSQAELRRAPFFAYCGMLFLVSVVAQLVWIGSFTSYILGDFLWAFVLVDVVVGLVVGYAFGVIAMARSRDAYGHGRMAVLAFIPLANLWLLLTPSKNVISANRAPTILLLTGRLGVATGSAFLIAGVILSVLIQAEMSLMVEELEKDPMMQEAYIDALLSRQGLEATLQLMASEILSQRINETTVLLRAEAEGKILRYVYEVSADVTTLPESMQSGLLRHNCAFEVLRPVIEAGGVIEHIYQRQGDSEIGRVTVTRDLCS